MDVDVWDSQGQDDYDAIRPSIYVGTNLFMICLSVVSTTAWDNVRSKWVTEVQRECPGVPFMLVGTKIDLRDDRDSLKRLNERQQEPISAAQGKAEANTIGALTYVECSALTQNGINAVFDEAFRLAFQARQSAIDQQATDPGRGPLPCLLL
jgi:Ras-related C3 botulinum toxin substrate 1